MSASLIKRWRQVQTIAYLQFWPVGQCESLQHSRHLLKGTRPQQCPDAQSESGTHDNPLALGAIHFLFLLKNNILYVIRVRLSTKGNMFWTCLEFHLGKEKHLLAIWARWTVRIFATFSASFERPYSTTISRVALAVSSALASVWTIRNGAFQQNEQKANHQEHRTC